MQAGFQLEILHASLGSAPPKVETVFVLAENQDDAKNLVRIGLRLNDQAVKVVRMLPESEWKAMGLKPFQVKHA